MSKPKIGFYWCASCGGCEEAVVDLAEDILGVVEAVDIVFWPVAMDFKKRDGFRRSMALSREYGLYRQSYCGCEFRETAAAAADARYERT